VLGGSWFLRGDSEADAAAPAARTDAVATSPAEVALDVTPSESSPTPVENERDAVAASTTPAPPSASMSSDTLELHGRLILVEADGSERRDVDGELVVLAWKDGFGVHHRTKVVGGEWRIALPERSKLFGFEVGEAWVEGRVVTIEDPTDVLPPDFTDEVLVFVRMPRQTMLRVVATESGADLNGVTLVARHMLDRGVEFPGSSLPEDQTVRDLRSPIDVSPLAAKFDVFGVARLLVGAEGRAWTPIELDLRAGGERTVSLPRGGDLLVRVRGVDRASRSQLRLRRERGEPPIALATLAKDDDLDFRGLAPGELAVTVEVGDWFKTPLVLGRAKAEVVADQVATVELVLDPPPISERARIAGVAYFAQEWPKTPTALSLVLLDTPLEGFDDRRSLTLAPIESARDGYRAFRWSLDAAQVGRYELLSYEPSFSIVIEAPRGGRDDFEFVVPPPVDLYVEVLDDATGLAVVTDKLHWNPRRPEGVSGGMLQSAVRAPDGGGYIVSAPLGEVDLTLWSDEYLPHNETVDTSRGLRRHTIRLRRGCGVLLSFVDDETAVAIPEDWHGTLRAVEGAGVESLTRLGQFERTIMVTEPGVYSIRPPKLAGYLQPPEQRIEIFAGEYTKHVVKLEREHP